MYTKGSILQPMLIDISQKPPLQAKKPLFIPAQSNAPYDQATLPTHNSSLPSTKSPTPPPCVPTPLAVVCMTYQVTAINVLTMTMLTLVSNLMFEQAHCITIG